MQSSKHGLDTFLLLAKHREDHCPSRELLEKLIEELNIYICKRTEPSLNGLSATESASTVLPEPQEPEEKARLERQRRWANRLRLEQAFPYELRDIFPPNEMIEPDRRLPEDTDQGSDGSLHAFKDPIHHLRLFANYLTPRKGMLSADTWRAVSVITRNLILTWLILLPVLITVMLLGQAYLRLARPLLNENNKHADLILMLAPLIVLVGFSVVIAIGWLICNRESASKLDWLVQIACLLALFLLLASGLYSTNALRAFIFALERPVWISLGVWAVITLVLFSLIWFGGPSHAK